MLELETGNRELRLAQLEVEGSRARYFDLYDLAPVGYLTVSAEGVIREANFVAARLLGRSRRALIKQKLVRFFSTAAHHSYSAMQDILLETRVPQTAELEVIGRDRKPFWVQLELAIAEDPAGGPEFRIVLSNIHERKLAEYALREANQKLRLHFEQTPLAFIEWDMDFRVTRWNPAAQTIFGYSSEEALGQPAVFIVPEAFRSQVENIWRDLSRARGGERSSNENISKDGTRVICEWYNTPLIDPQGTVTGVASVVMDITARIQAQELLAWEKYALEAISGSEPLKEVLSGLMLGLEHQLPGAMCSVFLLDEAGVKLQTGAAPSYPEAYIQAFDGIRIGPAVGSCGTAAYRNKQVIVTDIETDPLWAEYRALARSHGIRACWSMPIVGNSGGVIGSFAISYRETRHPTAAEHELLERAVHVVKIAIERKRAEAKIRDLNLSLERRVDERTSELLQANREAEAFCYSVSHDLRGPLRAVDGFSRMVLDDCAPDLTAEGKRMLNVVRTETQRMGRLIDGLLTLSRLGREPVERSPIDMHHLVREIFDQLSALEPERTCRFELLPLPTTIGQEPLIRQMWVNLISNALKFTQMREISEIAVGTLADDAGQPIFYVKDNGVGFEMRHADKLFEVFQRLHPQEKFPGTGVGLALVQRIIHRHRGTIWAESEPTRGTTFFFTLPNPYP